MSEPCSIHLGTAAAQSCGSCRADALAEGGDSLRRFLASEQWARCDRLFPPRYRQARADHEQVAAWVVRFLRDPRTSPSLLIAGPTGTGKTHQAFGALRAAVCDGRHPPVTWRVATAADLLAQMRPRSGVDTEAVIARWRTAGLVLIDDLGAAKPSEWAEEIIYRIVDARYTHLAPVIATTNVPAAELRARLGDRVASRLTEMTTKVILTGEDRRRQGGGRDAA